MISTLVAAGVALAALVTGGSVAAALVARAAPVLTFYWDRSKWQGVIPVSAFGPIECYRVDTGYGIDEDFHATFANAKIAHASGHLRMLLLYVVHRPGTEYAQVARVKAALGGTCPSWVRIMVDEESGAQFAGPGDHSAGANLLVSLFGILTGVGVAGVCGYANGSDWATNWATRVAGLKRIVARYSSTPPPAGWYGWQYSDGSHNWPIPAGYPFVGNSDMNVIPRSVDQILADFKVTGAAPLPPPVVIPPKEIRMFAFRTTVDAQGHTIATDKQPLCVMTEGKHSHPGDPGYNAVAAGVISHLALATGNQAQHDQTAAFLTNLGT